MLALLFLVTAFLYACVGFGGGSTYNALLVVAGTDYTVLPVVALLCNIIVVSGGVFYFARAGHLHIPTALRWIPFSVPAAFLGGYITVSELVFTTLLGIGLLFSGLRMLWPEPKKNNKYDQPVSFPARVMLSGGLGFLAGMTGIGGGIFLSPVLHLWRVDNPKRIAALCSLFILVNSVAGVIGQCLKLSFQADIIPIISSYWMLFPAVLIGGQLGSLAGSSYIKMDWIRLLTGVLVLYVAIRLLAKAVHFM